MRWREYLCGYCRAHWSVDTATVTAPVKCPGCGLIAYAVPMDKPPVAEAQALRALAQEMRQAARPYPIGKLPDVAASAVLLWAARLDDIAESIANERRC